MLCGVHLICRVADSHLPSFVAWHVSGATGVHAVGNVRVGRVGGTRTSGGGPKALVRFSVLLWSLSACCCSTGDYWCGMPL